MKTKEIHSAMIAICSLHVLQGVYDECQGTELFSQKRKNLANNLLKEVELYFDKLLREEDSQLQFNNAANVIEKMALWLCDNHGEEQFAAEQLANKIARIYDLMGFEVEQVS